MGGAAGLPDLLPFLAGATAMSFGLGGLFFLRFWTRSGERLFLAFAGAFWLLTLQTLSAVFGISETPRGWTYLLRVAAYLLIIAAVLGRNWGRRR